MKKALALLMALCMIVALCACGQAAAPAPTAAPAAAEKPAEAPAAAAPAAAEKTVLNLWCIATESDANHESYVKAIDAFNAAHDDVEIKWEAFENESYKTKVKAAAQAGELPDIFFSWSGAFLGDFANAGAALCLDDYYTPYADQLPEVMLANATYDGHHYAAPLNFNVVTLFANMDLLAQVGYDHIPATYEELTDCCDKLVAAGITPFGCSGKETWCVTEYLEPVIIKTIGAEELGNVFYLKSSWNNPDIATAVSTFQEMVNGGYFDPNGLALGNDEVKANFIAGKYAFYQNGSWNCGEIAGMDANVQVGEFPVMNADNATLGMLIGGPNDCLAVNAASPNAAKAAEAVWEIARDVCHWGTLAGAGLPSWTPDYDTSSINALSNAVAEMVATSNGMVLFGDNAQSANIANIYLDYVSQVYGCAIDGEGFIAGLTADIG
ncbi:MAG: extracellular solute-binding protein [Oscillospiraceae bacterium]|nr:extracellular solute-binding protein [Oscillospiraceae bacterium]